MPSISPPEIFTSQPLFYVPLATGNWCCVTSSSWGMSFHAFLGNMVTMDARLKGVPQGIVLQSAVGSCAARTMAHPCTDTPGVPVMGRPVVCPSVGLQSQKWARWLHNPCRVGGPHRFRAGGRIRSGSSQKWKILFFGGHATKRGFQSGGTISEIAHTSGPSGSLKCENVFFG